ncbi:hypothetical protein DR950_18250 [Kitasatospora xanthocidica]|uniref:Uncharacterized protein n=1 Tax=Kitasatospora xanthocidica TaxID=83382 RepID=A0A372ZU85_9ACTN|nr:hypothetical protein [Kitasatospora xanthocidica]RGD59476.1 hypothetical protein DR950_18250 [Kitasatospora xanthocidica]
MPSITLQAGERKYRYLWLKYITGIDLSRHCAVALHGRYSRHINETTREATVELDEFPHALAWYLCGVTSNPYKWGDNPHLALELAPRHTQDLTVHHLTVHLDGVRPIPFTDANIPASDPHAGDRAFRTCRNWQFAHYLRARGVPDVHGDRPRVTTLRPGNGQGELIPRPPRTVSTTSKGPETPGEGAVQRQAGGAPHQLRLGTIDQATDAHKSVDVITEHLGRWPDR